MAATETVLDEKQVVQRLKEDLPQWELREGWIRRKYTTGGWPQTLMAVNAVGYIAEAGFHHPDLSVSYAEVHVKLQTHSAKGITEKDLALAQLIEDALTWQPAEGQPLDGYEKGMKKKWTR